MNIEQRARKGGIELRRDDNGTPRIAGVAAVYYRQGDVSTEYELWPSGASHKRAVERIMPGAFDDAVKRDDVIARFNHDHNLVLGRSSAGTLILSLSERGLEYDTIPADTSIYRDTATMIERGDVQGSSFAFFVDSTGEEWRMDGDQEVREIHAVSRLVDVSPVTDPAYAGTTTEARSRWEERVTQLQRDRERSNVDRQIASRARYLKLIRHAC